MRDNTIKDQHGNTTNVYEDNIQIYADEYIDTVLNDKDDIKRKQCFAGMIKYIAKHIAPVDIDNLVLLNDLWDIYTGLCYKYNHVITIERFCILIGIARDTFYSWYKGATRNEYCPELRCTRSDTVKKWDRESESSMQDEASTGNPGMMFVLKSRRGWNENAPGIGESEERMLQRTPEQIACDYPAVDQLPQKDF